MKTVTQGDVWNHYVDVAFPKVKESRPEVLNPGDEWAGNGAFWDLIVESTLLSHLPEDSVLIEIGSGAGKQTRRVLERMTDSRVFVFDVSSAFIRTLTSNLGDQFGNRLTITQLSDDHREIVNLMDEQGFRGKVDALYSYDAMVHVDMQSLMSYFISATKVLKKGGIVAMDVANILSDQGFEKCIRDVKNYYRFHGAACTKFQFMSPQMIDSVLSRLGFSVNFIDDNRGHCLFVAHFENPDIAKNALAKIDNAW